VEDLSHRQDGEVIALVSSLEAAQTLDDFVDVLLEGTAALVANDLIAWNEIDFVTGAVTGRGVPSQVASSLFPRVAAYLRHHPLLMHFAATATTDAVRISDVCPPEQWEVNPLHREVFAPLGLHYQVGVAVLSTEATATAIALSRRECDFSDSEVALLRQLGPLVGSSESKLRWRLSVSAADDPRFPRAQQVGRGRLTAREVEALGAVADGATTTSAARKLGVSPRTLEKHLEKAYAKLGVNNRIAALAAFRHSGPQQQQH
jgi:DNA-binding CsgD family transcriptional regulator